MNVLLSVKPKYAKEILNGNKKYEFRKVIFRHRNNLDKVYIYSSSPVKRIVGAFAIESIIDDNPEKLWNKCKEFAGITKEEFFNYFKEKNKGFAIKIGVVEVFDPINPKEFIPDFIPPQSFCYLHENLENL